MRTPAEILKAFLGAHQGPFNAMEVSDKTAAVVDGDSQVAFTIRGGVDPYGIARATAQLLNGVAS